MAAQARMARLDPSGLVISKQSLNGRTLLEIDPIPAEETKSLGTLFRVTSIIQWFKKSQDVEHLSWHFNFNKESKEEKLMASTIVIDHTPPKKAA